MRTKSSIRLLYLLATTLFLISLVCAQNPVVTSKQKIVYQINIKEEISPSIARQFSKALIEAKSLNADLILIHMNTYGGLLDAADSIRTGLLNSAIPSVVFIDNNAASAGALISIACNKIYMKTGSNIGAATVVNEQAEALPDKYQSYMRSIMRSTAEARNRNPLIAEAMVDPRTKIPGINDSGKVLTFTASEALKNSYCNGIVETIPELLKTEGIVNYKIEKFVPTFIDKIIGFLIAPAISGVLILIMLGGLYYELQHPGIGFPIILAVIAAFLYFAPLYLDGLAQNWEIIISVAGILLLIAEIFIIPGFGIAGISGILLLLVGLTTSLLRNDGFDFTAVSSISIFRSMAIVLASMAAMLGVFIAGSRMLASSPVFSKMVLAENQPSAGGYTAASSELNSLIGEIGITQTVLRPTGKVTINHQSYFASSESGFIEESIMVEVIKVSGNLLLVKRKEN